MSAKHFTELNVWKKGHELILDIYKELTHFPKDELFGLTSQIKRASVSVTSNIAEGFVRHSKKEKVQFYFISLGSITEVENHLLLARDLNYIKEDNYQMLNQRAIEIAKMINSLIHSIHANY